MINRRILTGFQKGFTIVELMIATTVLSTILVLVTGMMIGIGNLYYKGINQSRVQGTVRNVTDEVAQHLQLTSDQPPTSAGIPINFTVPGTGSFVINAYCIGSTRYSYVLGRQANKQIPHVLWRDDTPAGGCAKPVNLQTDPPAGSSANGTELAPPNSRLTDFFIHGTSPYTVGIGIAYGDEDLLCNNTKAGDCTANDTNSTHVHYLLVGNMDSIQCRGIKGDQFCATAKLQTVVVKRLNAE